MMKLLSEAGEYGLRAVVWLATQADDAYKVKEIAEGTHAAPGYLVKVLQDLGRAGMVSARRGNQGGYSLVRDPHQLTVLEVINAIDPFERITACPLRLAEHRNVLCPLHRRIDETMGLIEKTFSQTTIGELAFPKKPKVSLCPMSVAKTGEK
jgi:Rrf2 family transcriptional regulator, nitric oxide-sensitive transcriptional repressor